MDVHRLGVHRQQEAWHAANEASHPDGVSIQGHAEADYPPEGGNGWAARAAGKLGCTAEHALSIVGRPEKGKTIILLKTYRVFVFNS
jgi:hypothetical protein